MSLKRFAAAPLLAALFSLSFCAPLSAALDPEVKKPYTMQVVLHFAQHRLLTPVFQSQVEHELKDGLQAALGDLAQVKIVYQHPRLDEVIAQGMQRALDSWNWLDETKTHFIFIDFVDGRYNIQARQYDGFAGLASPVVRQSQVDDRQLVSRQAALLVDQDFGLAGTLGSTAGKKEGDVVEVSLKGGALGAPLDHWIKKDDVLAVSQISEQGSRRHARRVPWTLLQVSDTPKDGVCRCRLFYRHQDPLPMRRGTLGYRCLKLGTKDASVRLRLISEGAKAKPLGGRQILISSNGFDAEPVDRQSTNADGLMPSPTSQKFRNIAFVKIYEQKMALAQVPVEIMDERTVTIPINDDPKMQMLGQLYRDRERWIRHLYDGLESAAATVKELNALPASAGKGHEEAMAKAQGALKAIDADIFNAAEERENLAKAFREADQKVKQKTTLELFLSEGDKRIADLRARRIPLTQYMVKLAQIIKDVQDPKRLQLRERWERGRLLERDAEFQQAIDAYESVFAQGYEDPQLREELNKLKQGWQTKSEAHRRAHNFIYDTWPRLRTAKEMKDNFAEAKKAFETCKKEHDLLRPQKILRVNVTHLAAISNELEGLRDSDDDKRTAEIIQDLVEKIKDLSDKISEYLRSNKPPE